MSFYTVHIHDIFNHNTSYNEISFKVLLSMSAGQFTHLHIAIAAITAGVKWFAQWTF